jgi:hypothetical protein
MIGDAIVKLGLASNIILVGKARISLVVAGDLPFASVGISWSTPPIQPPVLCTISTVCGRGSLEHRGCFDVLSNASLDELVWGVSGSVISASSELVPIDGDRYGITTGLKSE